MRTIDRERGRTLTDLLAESIEQATEFSRNSAHSHPRCESCMNFVKPPRVRVTSHGPWRDVGTLCGFCRAEDWHERFQVEQAARNKMDGPYLVHRENR